MRLNISDIPDEGLDQKLEQPVNILEGMPPDIARAALRIFRIKKKVFIEGSINIAVSLKCSRCCGDFVQPLDTITFREEYDPAEERSDAEEQELSGEELALNFYEDDSIDLQELIKEQVLLAVPMKPLCSEECKGICSRCGKDLNSGPCGCREEKLDPRLAPLQQLKETMKNRKPS